MALSSTVNVFGMSISFHVEISSKARTRRTVHSLGTVHTRIRTAAGSISAAPHIMEARYAVCVRHGGSRSFCNKHVPE